MLDRGHKLKVGQVGIVGNVTATGIPRIALDVGDDPDFFDNPDLPETRSEMALPLRVGDHVIGALDVQSMEPNAFQKEDIEVLSTLANQVSIAIQNAQSYETTRKLLEEERKVSSAFLRSSWQTLRSQNEGFGYHISGNALKSLEQPLSSRQIKTAIADKVTVKESGESATLAVPIRLREDVIGVMDIQIPEEHEWEADEVDIVEAVAERLSLALESTLLLKSTQRRAEIERVTAEITSKIGASINMRNVLQTAVEELGRALPGSDVVIQFQSDKGNGSKSK